jgi:hypothetical protein
MSGRPHSSTRTWVEHTMITSVADVRKVADYPKALADGSVIVSVKLPNGVSSKPVAVRLVKTHPHFGGVRIWYQCPHCLRRCGKLYAPRSNPLLGCRRCLDLSYFLQHRKSNSSALTHWLFYHEGKSRITKRVEKAVGVFQRRLEGGERINLAHL